MKNSTQYQSNNLFLKHSLSQNDLLASHRLQSNSMSIVVIDPSVEAVQMLAAGVPKKAEILILDRHRDGVEQIAEALERRKGIASLHLVSHGSPGCLYLGNTQLSLETLEGYAQTLKTWVDSSASIFLYGCQVAAGKEGSNFLQRLHQLTGANIAASTQLVGNSDRGGSWDLDYRIGETSGELAFLPEVRQTYPGVFIPAVRVEADPTTAIESEGDALTFRFTLSEPPPSGGVRVYLLSNLPQSLNQLDLFQVSASGADFPEGDFDFSGFFLNITAQTATVTVPVFDDIDGSQGAFDGERIVTYTLQPGTGYTIDSTASSATVNFYDTPDQVPAPPPPPPTQPEVSLTASPTILIESEQAITTLTFTLSQPPPSEGITVVVGSSTPNALNEFDLNAVNLTGGNSLTPNADRSGFTFVITQQNATLQLPVLNEGEDETPENFTFSLQSGEGYTVNSDNDTISLTVVDTEEEVPLVVAIAAAPTNLVESEQTLTTLTLTLSEAPPAEGLEVTLDSDDPDSLAEFDVSAAVFNGAQLVGTNEDSSGFTLLMTAQTATIQLPVLNDGVDEGSESFNFAIQPGEGYTADAAASSITLSIEDTATLSLDPSAPNNIFQINGSPSQTTNIEFNLVGGEGSASVEVGFFPVDNENGGLDTNEDGTVDVNPGDANYLTAALERGQPILSFLPDSSLSGPTAIATDLKGGTRFAFYLVLNDTTENILSGNAIDSPDVPSSQVILGSSLANNDAGRLSNEGVFTLNFETLQDDNRQDFNDLVLTFRLTEQCLLPGSVLQGTQSREIFDLRGLDLDDDGVTDTEITANFTVNSEAAFDNFVGLYKIDNEQGQIGDLRPGDLGYAAAAVERRVLSFDRDGSIPLNLTGDDLDFLAPFIIANGSPEELLAENPNNESTKEPLAYFNFSAANPDGFDHILSVGGNTFGFEDLFNGGDKDFDDMIVQVDFA
jgi:hypothetical protein